jgi:hypothetical protein
MEALKGFQLCLISFLLFLTTLITQTLSSTAFDDGEYKDWESYIDHIPNSILTYGYVYIYIISTNIIPGPSFSLYLAFLLTLE